MNAHRAAGWVGALVFVSGAGSVGCAGGGVDTANDVQQDVPEAGADPTPDPAVDEAGAPATCEGGACNIFNEGGTPLPAVCGDGICENGETCEACPVDCGECPACGLAPSCSNGASLPAALSTISSFNCTDTDGGSPTCGSGVDGGPAIQDTNCLAPQLKIGIADVRIVLNGVDDTLNMFCTVEAGDGHTSELIITPELMDLPDHAAPQPLSTGQGTFWGQDTGTPKLSQFPITINYQCFEVDDNSTWENILGAISMAAGTLASVPGNPYGWAFGTASAGAAAGQAAVSGGDGTSPRLNYQQTIDPSSFLELTNGKKWTVEQAGNTDGYRWDYALDIQAWGCSNSRMSTR